MDLLGAPRKPHDLGRPFSLREHRRRIGRAPFAVVMAAYLLSVSSRKVDDVLRALDADAGTLSRRLPDLRRLGPGAMNALVRSAWPP